MSLRSGGAEHLEVERKHAEPWNRHQNKALITHAPDSHGARGVAEIGIDARLAAELAEWKLAQKPEQRTTEALVVATSRGGPLEVSNFLSREFYPGLKAAKLPRVMFHSLRHTAATILASSNTPPGTVHRILGHASFATTMNALRRAHR